MNPLSHFLAAWSRLVDDLSRHPSGRARFAIDLAAARHRHTPDAPPVPVRVHLQVGTGPARQVAAAYLDDPDTDRTDVAGALRALADEIEAPDKARDDDQEG
ncbi:hypothetical protein BJF83_17455 [Nocardiopsis sp. CNR-923]|uniref:hypothetical protein n=1 Tax=Nocardiopsis sp. CNR-923 TaxID=1904965 RepID=UPI00096902AD|nr:hypothetical protein [Nocardiopsis sp. CNR-923]OLT27770.1 hypothetical protein BJF83_17455 [Nocardiopsis sp. CNR-923]